MSHFKQKRAAFALLTMCLAIACSRPQAKRVGMVIGLNPDKIAAYKALHSASNSGVRDLLNKYHMRNFSIYLRQLDDGTYYLFGYYEYDGSDYSGDMAKLAAEKRNIEWLAVTDPMPNPPRGAHGWAPPAQAY